MGCWKALAVVVVLSLGTLATHAQAASKMVLTLDAAKTAAAAAAAEARRNNAGGVIAIVDDGGHPVYLERLDNTFPAGANIAIGKARTAATFRRPTKAFEDLINKGRTTMVTLPDFTPLQGGIPIIVEGQVIGGIGVSGAASAQQDEEVAMAGANALNAMGASAALPGSGRPVTYIDSKTVAAAFAKGAVLIGEEEHMMHASRNYMVHASRRDAPGVAEVHTRDTDIIYVLDGSATFVTGGSVVEAKPTAAEEIRGKEINGGETRRITRGDVIIVPNGVPHWFQKIDGPFTYYVVKVRSENGK